MSFDTAHHGADHHGGDSHTSHGHSGFGHSTGSHSATSHSAIHSGGSDHHHTVTLNHNSQGGLSSATIHHPAGVGVIHQGLSSHDTHVHTTDGHNQVVYSTSGHGHESNSHESNNHHTGGHEVASHIGHGGVGNLGQIQSSSDPLSQANNAKFPSLKI